MRASSEPPVNKGPTSSNGLVDNPWYSEKAQMESILGASRPQGLPEQSPDPEREPLRDEGLHAGLCVGKGRGGQASSKPCFVTPPSKVSGSGRGVANERKAEFRMNRTSWVNWVVVMMLVYL